MRTPIIAGNWKMYKTISEAIELANGLKRELSALGQESIDTVICPPFTSLSEVADVLNQSGIGVGGQDAYWQDEGAFTGEVSARMVKDTGSTYCIIGHSERRQFFGETNETVNKKLMALLKQGLTPIVCVGEKLAERESGKTFEVILEQLQEGLKGLPEESARTIVIAYEPVWAIGTGKTATASQAQEVHAFIRATLKKMYNDETAGAIRIQYGGSVKPENIAELLGQPDVDGALVGGASLTVASFSEIVKRASKVKK